MYEERKSVFTLRDIVIQVLFIVLFIFLLLWLFPSKGFVNNKIDPLLDTIFNANIMNMKEAAKDYYTLERLPKENGKKTKITLKEMIDKKLIIEFNDKYGNACDTLSSYVEVEKLENEYLMKVNLKCSKQEDYIKVHMGCYDFCITTICEKKDTEIIGGKTEKPVKPVIPEKPEKPNIPDKPDKPVEPVKEYKCEYSLKTNSTFSNWSAWSEFTTSVLTVPVEKKEIMEVKTEQRLEDYKTVYLIGYADVVISDMDKPIYEYKNMVTKKSIKDVCVLEGFVDTTTTTTTTTLGDEVYMGVIETNIVPQSGGADRYELIATKAITCQGTCNVNNIYVSKWFARKAVITRSASTTTTSTGCLKTIQEITPIYTDMKVLVGYETKTLKKPVYKEVIEKKNRTYYSQRTRTVIPGKNDLQWNTCNNANLINQGWIFTGNKEEIKR